MGGQGAVPHVDHGSPSSCTASTTCSSAPRPARCRSRSRRVVSNHRDAERLCDAFGVPFHHLPVTPRHQGRGRVEAAGHGRRPRRGAGRAGPLHAGALRPVVPAPGGPGDQHPPLVPAQLQGRQALPPGPRRAGSSWSGPPRTTSPPTSTRARSSSRTSCASTTPTTRTSSSPPVATSRPRCSPAPSAGTRSPGSCSTATAPSSSADPRTADPSQMVVPGPLTRRRWWAPSHHLRRVSGQSPSSARRRTT